MFPTTLLMWTGLLVAPIPEEQVPGPGAYVEYEPNPGESEADIRNHLQQVAREIIQGTGISIAYILNRNKLDILKDRTVANQAWFLDQTILRVRPKLKRVEIWFDHGSTADRLAISNTIASQYEKGDLSRKQENTALQLKHHASQVLRHSGRFTIVSEDIRLRQISGKLDELPQLNKKRDQHLQEWKRAEKAEEEWKRISGRWQRTTVRLTE